jgi:hemoglobin/transferrin/lactoferrin receptor protein
VSGNRVQMLVDGTRVIERNTDGTRDFVDLPFVRNVEIVRGPASVLWGSDALGGTVAFTTVDPEDFLDGPEDQYGGELRLGFDSYNGSFTKTAIGAASLSPELQVLLGYSHRNAHEPILSNARADGGIWGCPRNPEAIPCNLLDPSNMLSHNAIGKVVWQPSGAHRLEFTAELTNRATDVVQRSVFGPEFSSITNLPNGNRIDNYENHQRLQRQRYSVEHNWDVGSALVDSVRWQLSYSPQQRVRFGDRYRTLANGDKEHRYDRLQFSERFLEGDLQLNSHFDIGSTSHLLTYGFDGGITHTDYQRLEILRNLTAGTTTTTRAGGFNFANATTIRSDFYIQDEIKLFQDRLVLTPGVRYAYYNIDPRPDVDYQIVPGKEPVEVSASQLTSKVGALFHLTDIYSVYGQYAEGFKMPTAEQLYTSLPGFGFNLIPAPDLRPEQVRAYEAGLRGVYERGYFSIGAFYNDYTDFIQSFYEIPGTSDITYRNLSQVQIWGVEASAEYGFTDHWIGRLALNYQYGVQKVDPTAPTTAFDGVNPLTAVVGLRWVDEATGFDAELVGTFAASVTRTSSPTAFKPDGYSVFDFLVGWRPSERFRVTAGVYNIFDTRYFKAPLPYAYDLNPSDAVKRTNPLELQTAPGRTFKVEAALRF